VVARVRPVTLRVAELSAHGSGGHRTRLVWTSRVSGGAGVGARMVAVAATVEFKRLVTRGYRLSTGRWG